MTGRWKSQLIKKKGRLAPTDSKGQVKGKEIELYSSPEFDSKGINVEKSWGEKRGGGVTGGEDDV